MRIAATHFITPFKQLDIVFGWMVAVPMNPVVICDAGFFVWRPNFNGPKLGTQVFVDPVLRTGNDFFGMVFEVMKGTDSRIACELGAKV